MQDANITAGQTRLFLLQPSAQLYIELLLICIHANTSFVFSRSPALLACKCLVGVLVVIVVVSGHSP